MFSREIQILDDCDLFFNQKYWEIEDCVDFICARSFSQYAPFLVESTGVKY